MSRTYRRKNTHDTWFEYDWVRRENATSYCMIPAKYARGAYVRVKLEGKELKKAQAEYHSDRRNTMFQVPSWFKTMYCRRPFRRKSKNELIRALKTDLEPVMPVDKNHAAYDWW